MARQLSAKTLSLRLAAALAENERLTSALETASHDRTQAVRERDAAIEKINQVASNNIQLGNRHQDLFREHQNVRSHLGQVNVKNDQLKHHVEELEAALEEKEEELHLLAALHEQFKDGVSFALTHK